MWVSLCRISESNIFGERTVFGMDDGHVFPQSLLVIIPLLGLWLVLWCCSVNSLHWMLHSVPSLMCGSHSQLCFPVFWEWCYVGNILSGPATHFCLVTRSVWSRDVSYVGWVSHSVVGATMGTLVDMAVPWPVDYQALPHTDVAGLLVCGTSSMWGSLKGWESQRWSQPAGGQVPIPG